MIPVWLRWDHNAHYHEYLLRRLPARFTHALDVGCGTGAFARALAPRALTVDAIDRTPAMIAAARAASPVPANVNWIEADVLDGDLELGRYDVVAAISSLHHMPLEAGLRLLRGLLAPGGTMVILGHHRASTASDFAGRVLATIANPLVGVWLSATGRRVPAPDGMPVRDPETSLVEVRAAAARLTPGAEVRRHLFFRYYLCGDGRRPEEASSPAGRLAGARASREDRATPLMRGNPG